MVAGSTSHHEDCAGMQEFTKLMKLMVWGSIVKCIDHMSNPEENIIYNITTYVYRYLAKE